MSLRTKDILARPLYIPAVRFLLFGVALSLSALAGVLYLWFFGNGSCAVWVDRHFKEAVSTVLFCFDLSLGIALLCDLSHLQNEERRGHRDD